MSQPLNLYISQQFFGRECIEVYNLKSRFILLLKSLVCLLQRVAGYDDKNKKIFTGWYDWQRDVTYITWVKKNENPN
jgi:hypothetical protein